MRHGMLSGHYGCDNRDGVGICRLGGVRFREVGARPSATASCRRLFHAVEGLRANEICAHNWVRSGGYKGECPNCGFEMFVYGMRCRSDCGSTVCYTCAHHQIPQRGWR